MLLERRQRAGLIVFPLIAKACAWRRVGWLAQMNVKPKNGTPVWRDGGIYADADLAAIAEEVAALLETEMRVRQEQYRALVQDGGQALRKFWAREREKILTNILRAGPETVKKN